MAIVADASGNGIFNGYAGLPLRLDRKLSSPNQTGTAIPATATYAGEIYLDTSTGIKYRAAASGATPNWYQITEIV